MSFVNRLFGKKDPQQQPLNQKRFLRAFEQFVNARTWTESQRIVEQNAILLHPDGDDLLRQLAATQSDQQTRQVVEEHRALLQRCREAGIEQAFTAKTGRGGAGVGMDVPPQFRDDLQRAQEAEQRYRRTGDRAALDSAAAAWERSLRHSGFLSSDDRFQLAVTNDAGGVYLRRYWAAGRLADLNRALELWQTAVQRTPPDSPDLPSRLNNLGTGLSDRYARTGALADLQEAIRVYQTAVQRMPPDSPDLPGYLNNLGTGLGARYARTGALADLQEAIRVYQTAVQRTPPDSPDLPSRLNNLGTGLRARYARTGALADLEEAIRVYQTALQLTPPDSPDLPSLLNNLGTGLRDRYARTGALADLEEAIRVYQTAVQRTPPDSPDLPSLLNNLGNGLSARYARTGVLADLEEAIRVQETAVQRMPPDSPDLPGYLNNLGNGLSDRYARTGALADLQEAIRVYQTAVQRMPPDSPDLPGYLNNLGTGLRDRYARTGALADLEEAIRVYQTAVQLTPPDLPSRLNNLGTGLSDRYARTGSLADLEEARERYRIACQRGMEVTPEESVRSARNWGNWALQRRDWQEATEAYEFSRRAIDGLFSTQTNRAAKESWLREAQGLPANAAYALARLGRLEEAVEALEAGRARLLAEALEANRRDLEQLQPLGQKDLLDRYLATSGRVTSLQQAGQPASPAADGSAVRPDFAALRRQVKDAREELDAAIAAIRQVPGYEDFFLPPSFDKIQRAILPSPHGRGAGGEGLDALVYLVTTSAGSLALVVRAAAQKSDFPEKSDFSPASPVEAVWLDGFSENDLNALLVRRDEDRITGGYLPGQLGDHDALKTSLAQTLLQLGDRLMGPLAAHLREQGIDSVVLIPSGRLSLLPLHAARYAVDGQERSFLDEFRVRYAPSAGALTTAQGESLRRHAPLSLAGVGNPLPDLETGIWAGQRAQVILDHLPAASSNGHLDEARQLLRSLADASPPEAIRAGELLMAIIRALALADAPVDAVVATMEIALRIPPSLNYAEAELHSVLDFLPADAAWTAFDHQATRDALWHALPAATWLHLACHGQFNPQEPLDSALLLAAGTRLTLRELLDRQQAAALTGIRLAFLSACQTAITDFNNVPDEMVGLPAGFLQAGIPAVVGTLWPVNDASTALLVTRFYELHLNGDPAAGLPPQQPAAALRRAQQWLRDVTNSELAAYLEAHHRLKEASEREIERMSWTLIKETRREVRQAVRKGKGDARPFEAAYHWAPFVFYGAG